MRNDPVDCCWRLWWRSRSFCFGEQARFICIASASKCGVCLRRGKNQKMLWARPKLEAKQGKESRAGTAESSDDWPRRKALQGACSNDITPLVAQLPWLNSSHPSHHPISIFSMERLPKASKQAQTGTFSSDVRWEKRPLLTSFFFAEISVVLIGSAIFKVLISGFCGHHKTSFCGGQELQVWLSWFLLHFHWCKIFKSRFTKVLPDFSSDEPARWVKLRQRCTDDDGLKMVRKPGSSNKYRLERSGAIILLNCRVALAREIFSSFVGRASLLNQL